jgi:6-phosphogluconolactonase (cycloisomerase 2 family)
MRIQAIPCEQMLDENGAALSRVEGTVMKVGRWAWSLLAATSLLAGCGDFWQSPNGTSSTGFTLTNSGNLTVSPGATSGNTATITVTPGSSFTGTVTLTCAVTAPSGATNSTTCSLSSSSLTFSSTTAQTSTLTATTASTTTLGAYEVAVTGVSGSVAETTTVCVEVGSGSCSTPPSTSGYFYILDQTTSQIIAYSINSGKLTALASYALPAAPLAIAVAPNNDFLYVSTLDGIYPYTISNGALTLENATPITTDPATAMTVDTTNSWLVEASGLGTLNAIPIVSTTGALSAYCGSCSVPLTGVSINHLVISPNDKYVFVAAGSSGTAAFGFTAANSSDPFGSAAYATIAPENSSAGSALSAAVDPSTRLLYVGEAAALSSTGGGLRAFTIGSSGGLTEISGSPFASGGTGPHAILPKSTGDYVYVANWNGTSTGNIAGFSIAANGSSYSLTNLNNSVATGAEPVALAEDSTEQFILAVSALGNPYFDAYYFDTTTAGQLDTTITSSAFAASGLGAQNY